MLAGRSMSGGMLMTWLRVWIASIGVPAAMRPMTGTAIGRPLSSSSEAARTRPRSPSMTLGVKPRERPPPMPWPTEFGQLDHLDGARPVRQAADEAALLQRRDQAVDAGLGPQVERVLHLVEGGRYARFGQPLVDEAQKLELLAGQHPVSPRSSAGPSGVTGQKQIMNGHYLFDMCSATI